MSVVKGARTYRLAVNFIVNVPEDYIEYQRKIRDPLESEHMCERVKADLARVFNLKSCKIHDFYSRRKLTGIHGTFWNYKLMRLRLAFMENKELKQKNITIYPSDVIRYVRHTLGVIEEIATHRFKFRKSIRQLADLYDEKFCFSLNCIKSSLKRTELAFQRLRGSGIIRGLDIYYWLKDERRSFSTLSQLYRFKFYPHRLGFSCIFRKELLC